MNFMLSVEKIKNVISNLAPKYGIDRVYLFGAYARGEATDKSDVDIRIDPGKMHGLLEYGSFYADLEDEFHCHIDMLTTKQLNKYFLSNIKKDEILIYERNG